MEKDTPWRHRQASDVDFKLDLFSSDFDLTQATDTVIANKNQVSYNEIK